MCPQNTNQDSDNESVDFFSLFFDEELWDMLLRETNRYACQFLDQEASVRWLETHKYSRFHRWPEDGISLLQIKKYIGLILNMGMVHKKKYVDYWSIQEAIIFNICPTSGTLALV